MMALWFNSLCFSIPNLESLFMAHHDFSYFKDTIQVFFFLKYRVPAPAESPPLFPGAAPGASPGRPIVPVFFVAKVSAIS
jgi:hypothetical protein